MDMARKSAKPLTRLGEVFGFCRANRAPVTIVGATPYGCLGLEGTFGNLQYLSALDCVPGMNRCAFAPESQRQAVFHTATETCNDLLRHQEVRTHIKARGAGQIWLSDADDETERLANELDVGICMAPRKLRFELALDARCRELLAKSGVPFVPSVEAAVLSVGDVQDVAAKAKLGTHLVIQFRDADGMRQTRFAEKAKDIEAVAERIAGRTVSVSKFVAHRSIAVECVVSSAGTLMGPIMRLYRGDNWSGACADTAATDEFRAPVSAAIKKLGSALANLGYTGVFTARFYVERNTDKVFLRRVIPGLTVYSQLSHVLTSQYSGLPLHAFHLLSFMDVSLDVDLASISKRWSEHDAWSIIVPQQIGGGMQFITKSPASSIYRMGADDAPEIVSPSINPADVQGLGECLLLRTVGTGTYRQDGLELGLLLMRGDAFEDGRGALWAERLMAQMSTVQMSGTSLPQRLGETQRISLF